MKTIPRINFITIAVMFLFQPLIAQEKKQEDTLLEGMHSITSQEMFDYVKELASEKYQGRLTGTAGYDSAAAWLAGHFEKWGLKPFGEKNTYYQNFKVPYTSVLKEGRVSLHMNEGGDVIHKHYDYVNEYMPGSTSDSGEVTAEIVYAGYGITAPELGYDDYKDVDVEGKIILIEREVPLNHRKNPGEFKKWTPYSYHQYKLKNAVEHGAVGMLYNYGPLANPNNAFSEGYIYSHIGDSAVRDIFAGTGRTHDEVIKEIKENLKPRSFNTNKKVTIVNHTQHFANGRGSNVIGFIEGSDPELKEEAIVVSAHLDHLGYCHEMIPGANDNASGVAAIMGVARALKEHEVSLKRSVVFVAFGAEEQGILGSEIYVKNAPVSLEKTVGLLNLDGVGVGDKIGVTAGKNYPELFEVVQEANDEYVHRELNPNEYLNITRPRLDAVRFMSAGVPSLSFYAYGKKSVYHRPGDDVDLITPEIMEDMSQLLYISVIKLANR